MSGALGERTIPTRPEELTPEWLTSALRSSGTLRDARVVGFESERLGVGEGFVGTIARIHLRYEPAEAGAPASLIGKFPIGLEQNKALGEQLGAYEREIRFYREMAHRVPIRTPRCYYADLDTNPMTGREEQVVKFLDRWPVWLIRLFMPIIQWLASHSRRRYVLLLEDLAPLPVGDQVAGCSAEVAERAVRNLAALHADFWGGLDGPEYGWLARVEWLRRWFHVQYHKGRPVFAQGLGRRFPRLVELGEFLEERGLELVERLAAEPPTLAHGDYRLDNMCLEPGGPGITTFDWQGPNRGPGAVDLAYFICGNLAVEVAAVEEAQLLRA